MKTMLLFISMVVLRCCWGPTEYQLMQDLQKSPTILKTLNGTYEIKTLHETDVSAFNLNIAFDENAKTVSGFSGCNRFFGSYVLSENTLKFKPLSTTKKLCVEDKNTIETKLLKAFEKADHIFFTEEGFTLFNRKKPLLTADKLENNTKISFEYTARLRGVYKHIKVDKDTISFSKKRKAKALKIACDANYWDTLLSLSDSIHIETIPNLEAPSKAFQHDGAALAHLKITYNGKTYASAPFDHGNPPKEIAALVKEILSSIENIE
jgi:heat shock protein HslJ